MEIAARPAPSNQRRHDYTIAAAENSNSQLCDGHGAPSDSGVWLRSRESSREFLRVVQCALSPRPLADGRISIMQLLIGPSSRNDSGNCQGMAA